MKKPFLALSFLLCLLFCLLFPYRLLAEELSSLRESGKAKPVYYIPGKGIEIKPLDLMIKLSGTFLLQAASRENTSSSDKYGGSWVGYLDFEKKFADWGLGFLRIEPGQGDTLNSDLNLLTGVNYNAHDNGPRPEVRQFWYKQNLLNKQIIFTTGKIESRNYFDKSIYAGNDDTQFLASIFNKSYAIEWPSKYGFGLNVDVNPEAFDFLGLGFNFFDAAAKWDHLFDNGIYTGEIKIKTPVLFGGSDKKNGGNYRFYTWTNTREHKMLLKNKDKDLNYGAGFSFDQAIKDVYGVFGRFGWQRPDLIPVDGGATLEYTWSCGTQVAGKYWNRGNDVVGFAVGQVFPSNEYKDAGNPGSAEGHVELYYNCAFNKNINISPDFQVVWNPNGVGKKSEGDNKAIYVFGLRAHLRI